MSARRDIFAVRRLHVKSFPCKSFLMFLLVTSLLIFLPPEAHAQEEPSFTIDVVPTSGRVVQGDGITVTVLISLSGEWDNKRIDLLATGLPAGTYAQFTPENLYSQGGNLISTLTLGTSLSTPIGDHEIAIVAQAENVGEIQSVIYTLSVDAEADFFVNVSPSHTIVGKGAQTSAVMTVTSSGGFSKPVQLSAGGVPKGVNISISPSTGTPPFESIITLSVPEDVDTGEYTITLTASGGGKTHSTTYTLQVMATEEEVMGGDLSGKIILGAIAICLIAAAGFVARS